MIALKTMFDPAAADGVDARYELRLNEQRFRVDVADGRLDVARGPDDQRRRDDRGRRRDARHRAVARRRRRRPQHHRRTRGPSSASSGCSGHRASVPIRKFGRRLRDAWSCLAPGGGPAAYSTYSRARRRPPDASRRPQTAIELPNRDTRGGRRWTAGARSARRGRPGSARRSRPPSARRTPRDPTSRRPRHLVVHVVEPQPAALGLAHVDAHAAAGRGDLRERLVETRAAIADQRAEHVAGQALAVHRDQHRLVAADVAAQQRDVLTAVDQVLPAEALELAAGVGRKARAARVSRRSCVRRCATTSAIDDRQPEPLQLGAARQAAHVLAGDRAQRGGGGAAGHPREIHRGLGVAGALEHAAGRARSGKTAPGRLKSSPSRSGSASARIVSARPPAETPEPTRSTDTDSATASPTACSTISGMPSSSSR